MNLYLIGFRGSGKSAVAPLLAERLGPDWSWADADRQIEESGGLTIREIFARFGEEGFRDRESHHLRELARGDQVVVATGGGIVLRAENRPLLRQGYVAWLVAPFEVLKVRIESDPQSASRRPALTDLDADQELRQLLARREPIYRGVAHQAFFAGDASPASLANQIAQAFLAWQAGRSASVGNPA